MTSVVSTNPAQQLFAISVGDGYSCLGFRNCYEHARQLAQLLNRRDLMPLESEIGKLKQYHQYRELVRLAGERDLGTYFDPGTPPQVRTILEEYRVSRKRIRIFLGDDVTGRDWLEEHDVYGRISRSMGPIKVPLMMSDHDFGGPAILTANIVRILDGRTGRELYRHPNYHQPEFTIHKLTRHRHKAEVRADGKVYARFLTMPEARRWVAFMKGESMRK